MQESRFFHMKNAFGVLVRSGESLETSLCIQGAFITPGVDRNFIRWTVSLVLDLVSVRKNMSFKLPEEYGVRAFLKPQELYR